MVTSSDQRGADPDVPPAPDDAVVDPHFAEMMAGGTNNLPASYMPAAPPGQVAGWRRGAVWLLLGGLTFTMATGLCITYGPEELWLLFQ